MNPINRVDQYFERQLGQDFYRKTKVVVKIVGSAAVCGLLAYQVFSLMPENTEQRPSKDSFSFKLIKKLPAVVERLAGETDERPNPMLEAFAPVVKELAVASQRFTSETSQCSKFISEALAPITAVLEKYFMEVDAYQRVLESASEELSTGNEELMSRAEDLQEFAARDRSFALFMKERLKSQIDKQEVRLEGVASIFKAFVDQWSETSVSLAKEAPAVAEKLSKGMSDCSKPLLKVFMPVFKEVPAALEKFVSGVSQRSQSALETFDSITEVRPVVEKLKTLVEEFNNEVGQCFRSAQEEFQPLVEVDPMTEESVALQKLMSKMSQCFNSALSNLISKGSLDPTIVYGLPNLIAMFGGEMDQYSVPMNKEVQSVVKEVDALGKKIAPKYYEPLLEALAPIIKEMQAAVRNLPANEESQGSESLAILKDVLNNSSSFQTVSDVV